jgi:TonB family protein
MMRLLIEPHRNTRQAIANSVVSLVVHVVVIGFTLFATQEQLARFADESFIPAFYFIPPDRRPVPTLASKTIYLVGLGTAGRSGVPGGGRGRGTATTGSDVGYSAAGNPGGGGGQGESFVSQAGWSDSVVSVLELDSAVARYEWSAAPVYPQDLLEEGIEGGAVVEFVVDTTGRVDTTQVLVVKTSHPRFAASVLEALAVMEFRPAVLHDHKVRQLVAQQFTFRIQSALQQVPEKRVIAAP